MKQSTGPNNVLAALLQVKNTGSNQSMGDFVKKQTEVANLVTKMVSSDRAPSYDAKGNRLVHEPAVYALQGISQSISQKDSDSETTLQMFPEINNAGEILISSIKSPQDMYTEEISFSVNDGLMVQPIINSILPSVKDYFTERIDLMDKFDRILRQCLLLSGSYPIAVIPENSLDDLINGTTSFSKETLAEYMDKDGFKSVGYLGSPDAEESTTKGFFGLENIESGLFSRRTRYSKSIKAPSLEHNNENAIKAALSFIEVNDNPNALKLKGINSRLANERMNMLRYNSMAQRTALSEDNKALLSVESFSKNTFTDREMSRLLYNTSRAKQQTFIKAKSDDQLDRYSIGEPLIMDLPADSFIPVVQPGSEDDPIGGFLLLDKDGHPLSWRNQKNHFNDMRSNFQLASANYQQGQDLASSLLRQAKHNLMGSCNSPGYDDAMRVWADIVEADLLARLRNGIFGRDVAISKTSEFYRMMLARSLAKQYTQVVFLPKDMITYFTYKVTDDGIGKSLLEDTRIISAMRAQLLFARVQGEVKNAIGRTRVNVTLPEGDPNPNETAQMVAGELLRRRSLTTPVGTINPSEVADQVNAMGMEINFDGSTIPDLKIEYQEVNTDYVVPTDSIEDILKKRVIAGLSVPVELVDAAEGVDFATIAISNHLLFAKKVRDIQRIFTPQLSNFVRQVLRADTEFVIMVKKTILEAYDSLLNRENIPEDIKKYSSDKNYTATLLANEFISNVNVELTKPDTKSLENLVNTFEENKKAIDAALEAVFSTDVVSSLMVGGKTVEQIDSVKAAIRASLLRRKMQEIGMAEDVFDVISEDKDGNRVFDTVNDIEQHSSKMASLIVDLLSKTKIIAQAADTELTKIESGQDPNSDAYSSPSGDDFGSSSGDDFGLGELGSDSGASDETPAGGAEGQSGSDDDLSTDINGI